MSSKQDSLNGSHHFTKQEVCEKVEELLGESGLKERALVWSKFKCPTLEFARKNKRNVVIFVDNDQLASESHLANFCLYGFRQLAQFDWELDPLDNTKLPADIKRGYHFNNPYRIASNFLMVHFNPESSLHREKTYRKVYNEYHHLKTRYHAISTHYNKKINILSTDFVDQGDLIRFVDECNQQAAKNIT